MANNQINKLLEFANMQMAAEAFLIRGDEPAVPANQVVERLVEGNTHASKFMPVQADQFTTQYEVLAQYRNDPQQPGGTGFSATLFKNRETGELTLSFRSTEFIDDEVRDSKATNDLEIADLGWAFGQIAEMEAWYNELRGSTAYLADGNGGVTSFNVTGYSLGGHLAAAFNILRREESMATGAPNPITATYTFNGAGTGGILNGRRLTDLVADFNRIRANYTASPEWLALSEGERNNFVTAAQLRVNAINGDVAYVAGLQGVANSNFGNSTAPAGIQADLGYQIAALIVHRDTVGALASNPPTVGGPIFVSSNLLSAPVGQQFSNMTEIVGMETQGLATSFVSNSGIHYGNRIAVPIEAQPLYRGNFPLAAIANTVTNLGIKLLGNNPGQNDFADTHSLVLVVDSLSLMAAMEKLAPTITIEIAGQIFAAASNAAADQSLNTQGKAESDTLERMLDALRKLVMGSQDATLNEDQMRQVLEGNTWSLNAYREPFQTNLKELRDYINNYVDANSAQSSIDSLVNISAAQLADFAGSSEAIAYRYALQELNPFAVVGDAAEADFYVQHDLGGELDLYDGVNRNGSLTAEWIIDRAEFLSWKNTLNIENTKTAEDKPYLKNRVPEFYSDVDTGTEIWIGKNASVPGIENIPDPFNRRYVRFGGDGADTLLGGVNADHLYGGAGNDSLTGGKGTDYLQGGSGSDTYIWNIGEGFDTIFDTDGIGAVVIGGDTVSGGIRLTENDYISTDEQHILHFEGDLATGGVLVVDGELEVANFINGDLGITLSVGGGAAQIQPTTYSFTEQYLIDIGSAGRGFGTEGADSYTATSSIFVAKGGNDLIQASSAIEWAYLAAGAGDDVILGADSLLFEDDGATYAEYYGDAGSDIILGGELCELILGDNSICYLSDYILFSAPAPGLSAYGGFGFYGGFTSGTLDGHGFWGAADVPELSVDPLAYFYGTYSEAIRYALGIVEGTDVSTHYNDYIDGGGGADNIFGGVGSDVIYAGAGDDIAYGDGFYLGNLGTSIMPEWLAESISLFGAAGNDYIDGGDGNDLVGDAFGSASRTAVFGYEQYAGGNDTFIGGTGNDAINNEDPFSETGAYNLLNGGDGDDHILSRNLTQDGYDVLIGGHGNDSFNVEYGSATIEDDSGSDTYFVGGNYSRYYYDDELGNYVYGVADPLALPIATLMPQFLSINDFDASGGGIDRLQFVSHTAFLSELFFSRDEANLYVGKPDNPEWITVENWFAGQEYKIEEIVYDDSSTVGVDQIYDIAAIESQFTTPTEDADFLWGSDEGVQYDGGLGDDKIYGGAGNDVLVGGEGNDLIVGQTGYDALDGAIGDDTYVFNKGDGVDTISDSAGDDTIQFGEGILSSDLVLDLGSLLIHVGAEGDAIRIEDFDPNDTAGSGSIEHFTFANGTTLSYAELLTRGFDVTGTYTSDNLSGTDINDRIQALYGDDTVTGGAGDDVLDGGAGNDLLDGGTGGDVYQFGRGHGADTIQSADVDAASVDILQFKAGISEQDVQVSRSGADISLAIVGTPDSIKITNGFTSDIIDRVTFANGNTWDATTLRELATTHLNTAPFLANALLDQVATEDTIFSYIVPANTFADVDVGDTLTYSATLADATALPTWLTFDAATRTFSGVPLNADVGNLDVRVTATDIANASVSDGFQINVANVNDVPVPATAFTNQATILLGQIGNTVLEGSGGNDSITAGDGNDLIIGGAGNDTINTGAGANVIARGGGADLLSGAEGAQNTLSLGGGIGYGDLSLSKSGDDLVMKTGQDESVTLKDWYLGSSYQTLLKIQMMLDATADFDLNSADPMRNQRVQSIDFLGLVSEFDQTRGANPALTNWQMTDALAQFHLSGSNDAAIGGDLAYYYGVNGGLTGISLNAAQQVIGAPGFGQDAQSLRPFLGLQEGMVRLS